MREDAEIGRELSDTISRTWFSGDVIDYAADDAHFAIGTGYSSLLEIRLINTTAPLVWRRSLAHIALDQSHTYIIWFVLNGSMKITGPNGTHLIRSDKLCVMAPHVPFLVDGRHTTEEPLTTLTISAPAHVMGRHISAEAHTGLSYDATTNEGIVAERLFRILFELGNGLNREIANRLADDAVHCVCKTILAQSHARSKQAKANRRVDDIRAFITANLSDPDLSGDLISAGCGISRRHLHHLLKARDMSLTDLIWKQRLYVIAKWLGDEAMAGASIAELAYSAGYKNYEHFCRSFGKTFGHTPSAFRIERTRQATPRTEPPAVLP